MFKVTVHNKMIFVTLLTFKILFFVIYLGLQLCYIFLGHFQY